MIEKNYWRAGVDVRTSIDGASEVDADALLETVWQGIDALLGISGPLAEKIAGVAVCTFVGNIMAVDRRAKPLTPVYTYADTRAEAAVAWLRAEFDEDQVHERTGCHFHSSYLPARFRWLAQCRPAVFHQAERWVSIGEYLELKLFGRTSVSYSAASWSGLLNRHQLVWDEQLLKKLLIDISQLSPLTDLDTPQRGLREAFAKRWPLLSRLPWFPASGDGVAANAGSGCVTSSRVALTLGTTSAVRSVVERTIEKIPTGLWCYRVDKRRSLPGGALSEGGNLFSWMRKVFQLKDPVSLESDLRLLAPDGHGLTLLPFLSGERSPGWQGSAKASIHGISQATTPVEIVHAGLEAVAYRIALVFQRLSKLLPSDVTVIGGGGALRASPAWCQIISDVMNKPVAVADIPEASARGAALLAFEALGVLGALDDIPIPIERTYDPDPGRHAVYQSAMERHQKLYQKLVNEIV